MVGQRLARLMDDIAGLLVHDEFLVPIVLAVDESRLGHPPT
jgi:hypothetical protein